jgi:NAD(P)-dependent dehydrogenase (short-subunit alcohol dehydrogenase family)
VPGNFFDLSGKVALVTGGNSGLGLAFAEGVAEAGGDVVLWGRRPDRNAAAVDRLERYGGRVASAVVDVADEAQVVAGITAAVGDMGRLDCVIANAGISTPLTSFLDMTSAHWNELLDINLHGAFYVLREAARHMVDRADAGDPGGSLIVNGSTSALAGVPGIQHYTAAKGALLSMVRSIAVEFGPYGIRANMIAPGYMITNLNREKPSPQRVALDAAFEKKTPVRRNGTLDDVKGAAVYLMSDRSAFHTGDVLVVDGGSSINLMPDVPPVAVDPSTVGR